MIKNKLFLLCERAIVDTKDNDLSLIGVIDEFTVSVDFPVQLGRSMLVLWSKRSDDVPDDVSYRITARNNEREIFSRYVNISFGKKKKNRMLMNLAGLPIVADGPLTFTAMYQEEVFATQEILVKSTNEIAFDADAAPVEQK